MTRPLGPMLRDVPPMVIPGPLAESVVVPAIKPPGCRGLGRMGAPPMEVTGVSDSPGGVMNGDTRGGVVDKMTGGGPGILGVATGVAAGVE